MRFDLLSGVPEAFEGWAGSSMMGRGQAAGAIEIVVHDLRPYGLGRYKALDDYPFGGGAGMLLRPEPLDSALSAIQASGEPGSPDAAPATVVLLSAQGQRFDQALARELSALDRLVLVCGRYEGVDERVCEHLVTREVSIGDYVLTGGELAAMVMVDAIARLIPGVLGDDESASEESFSEPLLEYPHYTRPAEYRGWRVPELLTSGHHERVRLWRRTEQLRRTLERRPDLVQRWRLSDEDRRLLARIV